MPNDFVHLRVHSEYSLKDSTIRIFDKERDNLVVACDKSNQKAVALTDEANLFATITFYKNAIKQGIKPIIGAELWIRVEERLVLMPFLAMNDKGYRQLCTLISSAWMKPKENEIPVVDFSELAENCSDLIVLCGGLEGALAPFAIKQDKRLSQEIERWLGLFSNRFYLEIHRIGRSKEETWINHAVRLSQEHQIPLVATNKACFINELDFHAHEARVSIHRRTTLGSDDLNGLYTKQQYLRSTSEMIELFSDLPIAIENSVLIAQRCNVEIELGKVEMPNFEIEGDDLSAHFREVTEDGLQQRLQQLNINEPDTIEIYQQRLETEINVIEKMSYIGYFLIVADFIQWAKNNAIPVGPGRGSGAGSLVAYALKITDIDPICFGLIFERFLNDERKSMPDFDIDFCTEGRDRVIDYVVQKYGESQVAQIITFGTLSARAVVRDVARILGLPYVVGDNISKLIPNQPDITINRAFELSREFKLAYNTDEEVGEVVDLSMQLEGLVRNVGKHAGGIVIAPSHIEDFCPVYVDSDNDKNKVTQFHKDALEDIGLVKFDFLGLKNLTTMNHAVKWINSMQSTDNKQAPFSLEKIDYSDQKVYKTISAGSVLGVFQLESGGIRRYTMILKPTTLDHLTDMLALYRPGPLGSGMVDKYMRHRQGEEREKLLDDALEPILESTNGVIIYQEQVMQIAQRLAGFSLGNADVLRQAMGKKDQAKMAQKKTEFIKGAESNGINVHIATEIFEQMERFAEYGFNKSHSVAYAVVSYQTAYLKYHFPAAYMAAMMTSDSGSQERLHDLAQHCKYLGLRVKVVDINTSEHRFVPVNDKEISWSLAAVKGVGEMIAEQITLERQEHGAYKDFFDFCVRVSKRDSIRKMSLSKRVLEMLIYSGAFDSLHPQRELLFANIERAVKYAQEMILNEAMGQGDLFSKGASDTSVPSYLSAEKKIPILELLHYEKKTTGIYLNLSPYNIFYQEVRHYGACSIKDFLQLRGQSSFDKSAQSTYMVLGEIEKLRMNRKIQKDKKNQQPEKKVANSTSQDDIKEEKLVSTMEMRIGDGERNLECVIRDEGLQSVIYSNNWFNKQLLLLFVGTVRYDDVANTNSLEVINVLSIGELRTKFLEAIVLGAEKKELPYIQQKLEKISKYTAAYKQEDEEAEKSSKQSQPVEVNVALNIKEDIGEIIFASNEKILLDDDRLALLLAQQDFSCSIQKKQYAANGEINERE